MYPSVPMTCIQIYSQFLNNLPCLVLDLTLLTLLFDNRKLNHPIISKQARKFFGSTLFILNYFSSHLDKPKGENLLAFAVNCFNDWSGTLSFYPMPTAMFAFLKGLNPINCPPCRLFS